MPIKNVEIKARCQKPGSIRSVLQNHDAFFKGTDHQIDTYFRVKEGRLKLRQGTIENNLIFYRRPNTSSPKPSDIRLVPIEETNAIRDLLTDALEVLVTVDKQREIYFIDNVKFHIDEVTRLGSFVEIEAIDEDGSIGENTLYKQCTHFMQLFGIAKKDLIAKSYSDMLLELK